jgi:hypothetical protein
MFGKDAQNCVVAVAATALSSLLLTIPFMMGHALQQAFESVMFNF